MLLQSVTSLKEASQAIEKDDVVLFYFTTNDCSVCHSILPRVADAMEKADPKAVGYHISIPDLPEASGYFMAFSAPLILVYGKGKEVLREAGIIDLSGLSQRIQRQIKGYI